MINFCEILKYLNNIVCLSGISSDGSICWEGREYQCAGLFTENLVFEGNPITRSSSSERFAECLRLTAIMIWIGFIMDKNYSFLCWYFDMRVYCSHSMKPKSNFFYEDISAWGKHAWYRCLRQQKQKAEFIKLQIYI